jgi:hypothetical protein
MYQLNLMHKDVYRVLHHGCSSMLRGVTERETLLPARFDDRDTLMRPAWFSSQSRWVEQQVEDQDAG